MKISNEFKIGLMAIITIALSVWGYQFLRGRNIIKASNTYYARYDNIDQLAVTSPVLIHGVNVGTVTAVELDKDMNTIIVAMTLNRGLHIPTDAVAMLISTGIMGGKAIELKFDHVCSGDDCAKPGTYLRGEVKGFLDSILDNKKGGGLDQIKTNIGDILRTVGDSLTSKDANNEIARTFVELSVLMKNLAGITGTLNNSIGAYDRHLKNSLGNLESLTSALSGQQTKIADAITHLDNITKQFDEANVGDQAGKLLTDASEAMKSLNATMADAQTTFAQFSAISKDLEEGKGTLGQMLKDQELYDNLTKSTKNLDLLLQDFRLNPKRYVNVSVFGKKQKAYNVPEDDPAYK